MVWKSLQGSSPSVLEVISPHLSKEAGFTYLLATALEAFPLFVGDFDPLNV